MTYHVRDIARAALAAYHEGTLCARNGDRLHYISDECLTRCAVGAGLSEEDAWRLQKHPSYHIDILVEQGVIDIQGDVASLRRLQVLHDREAFADFLTLAYELAELVPLSKVRELIAEAEPDLTDMCRVGVPHCGAPGCIMGWARADGPFEEAYPALGLTRTQGDNLSLGNLSPYEISQLKITKAEVLTALDSLLEDPKREMPAWPKRVIEALRS